MVFLNKMKMMKFLLIIREIIKMYIRMEMIKLKMRMMKIKMVMIIIMKEPQQLKNDQN